MRVTTRERGTIPGCTPMTWDKTMLEVLGLGVESTADQYCKAIADFIKGNITESECFALMSAKRVRKL